MTDILLISFITLLAYGVGNFFVGKIKDDLSIGEDMAFSTGFGLGILAYVVYFLGLLKALYSNLLIAVLFILFLLSLRNLYLLFKRAAFSLRIKELSFFDFFLGSVLTAAFVFSLAGALAPPIGNDALAYHLYHPRIFTETHSVGYIPYTRESLWPYLTEMLFTLGMMLKGAVLAKLFHYLFGILSALAVFCFARRFIGKKTGLIAAVLFYLAPGIFMQASYAYIDLALCFYVFCSLYLFVLWEKEERSSYLAFSGIFSGLALSVKVLAGTALIPLILLIIIKLAKDRAPIRKSIMACTLFIMPVILFSFVWYLRSFIITGNPVYPAFYGLFKSGWPGGFDWAASLGYVKGIIGFLRLPWDLVMHVDSFGAGEQIGFLFLALFPCLFFVDWKNSASRTLLFFGLTFTMIWFFHIPAIRYFFPVFPVIFLLYSSGLNELLYRKRFQLLQWCICAGLIFNLALAGYYNLKPLKLLTGGMDRESYLTDNERAYKAAKWVNESTEKDAVIVLVNEPRMFYFKRPCLYYPNTAYIHSNRKELSDFFKKLRESHENIYLLIEGGKIEDDFIALLINKKEPLVTIFSSEGESTYQYSIYAL